jgi:hypothetical protein
VLGRTDCDLPIPIEDEVLHGEALTGLSLPLVILGSRPQESDAIGPATGDELIGRDIASIDEVSVGQQTLGLEPIMNGVEASRSTTGAGVVSTCVIRCGLPASQASVR